MKKASFIVGKEYKYLHDSPPSTVKYLKPSGSDFIFVDSNDSWISVRDTELSESIAEVTGKKIEVSVKKQKSILDFILNR
jgi:hypothetical protein